MKPNQKLKKQLLAAVLLLPVLFAFSPHFAKAQEGGGSTVGSLFSWLAGGVMTAFGGALGSAIGWVVYVVNYIVATIFGVAIAIIAYFIGVMLQLNTHVVDSQAVQTGFKITLALANLGFVIAIIVMAIGTILRYESYTVKKMLPKLVAAAILVNFSLVIAGTILNFADQMSLYFLNQTAPSGTNIFYGFPGKLAGAFGPQRAFFGIANFVQSGGGTGTSDVGTGGLSADDYKRLQGGAQSLASIFVPLLNLFFPTIFLIIMVITLVALWVMLLIRYIYLGILLILMPFAWLLWLFPQFKSQWDKWWHNFIRWTFFSPIVVFFLYLALTVADGMNQGNWQNKDPGLALKSLGYEAPNGTGIGSTILAGLSTTMGSFVNNVIGSGLQMVIMIGLVLGGLFAANAMGITFASTAYGFVQSQGQRLGKGIGRWSWNKTKQYGGAAFRKKGLEEGAQSRAEKIQGWAQRVRQKNRVLGYGAGWISRGVTRASTYGGRDVVRDYEKDVNAKNKEDVVAAIKSGTLSAPNLMAHLMRAGKEGWFAEVGLKEFHGREALFRNFSLVEEFNKNIEKKSGVGGEAFRLMEGGASQEQINKAQAKFAAKNNRGDIASSEVNDLMSKKLGLTDEAIEKLRKAYGYGIAVAVPELASTVLAHTRSDGSQKFQQKYFDGLNAAFPVAIDNDQYTKRWNDFKKIIDNNALGFTGETTGGGTTPPPTPGPTPAGP